MYGILLVKVENSLTKGEIARYEQFLLLSECFQKASASEVSENVFMWEKVKADVSDISILGIWFSEEMNQTNQYNSICQYDLDLHQ